MSDGETAVASGRAPEGMAGLAKGLAVIEAFGRSRTQLTVADAARVTDTSRAAARRCLLTLVELGYLTHDGKHFRPTPRMLRLGASYLMAAPLPQLAQPFLDAARAALDESISLAVLDCDESVFIARAEADHIVSAGVRLGSRLPAYCSATGRVLLASLPDAEITTYLGRCVFEPRTNRTLVDARSVTKAIERVRVNGYELTDEELELGMRSMAVPVRDMAGKVVAAMSASAFTVRVTREVMLERFLPELQMQAERLGRML